MKADLSRFRLIHPVSPLTALDVDTTKQTHLKATLEGDIITVINSTPGHAVPEVCIPLSNVAGFIVKKPEEKGAKK